MGGEVVTHWSGVVPCRQEKESAHGLGVGVSLCLFSLSIYVCLYDWEGSVKGMLREMLGKL